MQVADAFKYVSQGRVWGSTPVIPVLKLRQEDHEFSVLLCYIVIKEKKKGGRSYMCDMVGWFSEWIKALNAKLEDQSWCPGHT